MITAGELDPTMQVIPILLPGEDTDPARRGGKIVLVESTCRFVCDTLSIWDACVDAIRASDEHLRRRPAERMLWDWQKTSGGQPTANAAGWIDLGVAWYDLAFFLEKRDVWFGRDHLRMYSRIGVPIENITVTHWIREEAATEYAGRQLVSV